MIIDPAGLNVYPKESLTEFIKWDEIKGFEEIKIQSTKILIILVKDPYYWLEKETSPIRKKIMEFNINNYNSPFNVSATGLAISSRDLMQKLSSYFEKYKTM